MDHNLIKFLFLIPFLGAESFEVKVDEFVTLRIEADSTEVTFIKRPRLGNDESWAATGEADSFIGQKPKIRNVFFDLGFLKHLDSVKAPLLFGLKNSTVLSFPKPLKNGKIAVAESTKFKQTWGVYIYYQYPDGKMVRQSGIGFQLQPYENLMEVLPEVIDRLERRLAAARLRSEIAMADFNPPPEKNRKTFLDETVIKNDQFFELLITVRGFTITAYVINCPLDMRVENLVAFDKKKAELLATERNREAHAKFMAGWKKKPENASKRAQNAPDRTMVHRAGVAFENLIDFLETLHIVAVWLQANKILKKERTFCCSMKGNPDPNATACCQPCCSLWDESIGQLAAKLKNREFCPEALARTAWYILTEAGWPMEYSRVFPLVWTILYNRESKNFSKILEKFTLTAQEKAAPAAGFGKDTWEKFKKNRFAKAYSVFYLAYEKQASAQKNASLKLEKNAELLIKSLKKDAYRQR